MIIAWVCVTITLLFSLPPPRCLFKTCLQVIAPALRAILTAADNQLMRFSDLQEEDLDASVEASIESLKLQLRHVHRQTKAAMYAKGEQAKKLQELDKGGARKFSIRTMACGTVDDFHLGLQHRIG